jgi:hypothetical protein
MVKSIAVASLKPGHRDAIQRTVTEKDAQVEVKEITGNQVKLYTTCTNQQSVLLVEGVANVIPPRHIVVNREDLRRHLNMAKVGSKVGVKL